MFHAFKSLLDMNTALLMFDDKRLLIMALFLWTMLSSAVFCVIMVQDQSDFLTFGPNPRNKLLGVALDNWFKWWVTAIYTFISTAIAAFSGDSLWPFITNTIQDHKTVYIPYSKAMCLAIIQIFTIYGVIMSVIGMFVALTQVDFMLIRISADILINHYTTFWFLRGKKVDPVKYELWKEANSTGIEMHVSTPTAIISEQPDHNTEFTSGESEQKTLLRSEQGPNSLLPNDVI